MRFSHSNPRLQVLAGMHRVIAAQRASKRLQTAITRFEKGIETAMERVDDGDDDYNPNTDGGADDGTMGVLQDAISVNKEAIEAAEIWPVHLYDIGEPRSPSGAGAYS
jgi:hypothetical protein